MTGMKIKPIILLAIIIITVSCFITCHGEAVRAAVTAGEEWSWEPGAENIFDGIISLKEYAGQELTICMNSDLPYQNEEEQTGSPVFTSVNGKRITMMKQSDTAKFLPSEEMPDMNFSARFTMPSEKRVYSMTLQFALIDESGNTIKTIDTGIKAGQDGAADGPFYIPADISTITMIICIAAALVWIAAVIVSRRCRKS